ncbi:MAG: hypothetical protein RB191_23680, partial [Terriglobia bacterium]|nr:hypothetical protein [Terriglobia bacterium]
MTDDTAKIGAALKAHKGPAGAIIRQVSLDEAGGAFEGQSGEAVKDYPGANKVGGPGGKGSTAGIRTGARDSEGKPIGP